MDTLKYTLKRVALMLVTLFVIFTIVFVLIKLLPNPLPENANEAVIARREALGYNKSIVEQYFIYLGNIVTKWDWGASWNIKFMENSSAMLVERIAPTLIINMLSFLVAVPLGILLGIYIAQKKNKWQDHVYGAVVVLFISLPSFVFAFILQYFVAFQLGWFTLRAESITQVSGWFDPRMLYSLVLPVLAMVIPFIASSSRTVRAELSEQLNSEYMLLARCKGLSKREATYKHCLKNAMVPVLPLLVGAFILNFSAGSIVIESVFSIPGTGSLYIEAINRLDYDVFMVTSVFFVFVTLFAGLMSDLSYSFLDPRIKVR